MANLKNELANARYTRMTNEEAAADLNIPRIDRNRTSMSGREIAAEIVDAEYNKLASDLKQQVLALVEADSHDPFGFAANVIKDIFQTESVTFANLAVARVETISRATELGLPGIKVGWVEEARRDN